MFDLFTFNIDSFRSLTQIFEKNKKYGLGLDLRLLTFRQLWIHIESNFESRKQKYNTNYLRQKKFLIYFFVFFNRAGLPLINSNFLILIKQRQKCQKDNVAFREKAPNYIGEGAQSKNTKQFVPIPSTG
ncbi:hypothetical protein BpHYR1_042403 [Brachionus plicatilis]|uniref:Uncharacterized protein n=1 Tax=Brachionus plicatilis TaxID=10195 RepID=A0A3M7RIT3_BRAPC|nr:hypothetical protein BpHYR1_042403 [Brachionus plicatilis]